MKIVNVEDYFIPDAGYQINIMPKYLSRFGHDVYVVTSTVEGINKPAADFFGTENISERDEQYTKQTGVKIIRVPPQSKKVISGRMLQSRLLFRTVDKLRPDVVYVHGNDSLTGMRYLSKRPKKYAVVTDSHMLGMATQNRLSKIYYWFYRHTITPKIIRNQIPVIRTQNDPFVEQYLGIPLSQAPWISYGSDTQLFHPDMQVRKDFRLKNNISEDDFVVVYTGKLDESKGGQLLADAASEKFGTDRSIVFVVVGNTDGEYGERVEQSFGKSENRVIRFPTQKYCDLAEFYQAADLSVFAKQCSLSFYDAQACGLPVLSEDNNINVDRCSHENGWNFKSGDVGDFRRMIEYAATLNSEEYSVISHNALKYITDNYNYEDKAREYEKVISDELKRYKEKM
ncbi:MAG: glycosyltransferase family 4 protein [Clostridiales bacterium]|nr:glycosyltransferase family 4 protein [Clostridiales bacterium]